MSYILFTTKKKDLPVLEVDYQFISRFEHYMKSKRECSHNTTTKYIVNFKKIMRIAYANQWIDRDPFFHWKSNWRTKEREFLTASELNIMAAKEFDIDRLDLVRDIFLFCCFSSLAYADVNRLSYDFTFGNHNGHLMKIISNPVILDHKFFERHYFFGERPLNFNLRI